MKPWDLVQLQAGLHTIALELFFYFLFVLSWWVHLQFPHGSFGGLYSYVSLILQHQFSARNQPWENPHHFVWAVPSFFLTSFWRTLHRNQMKRADPVERGVQSHSVTTLDHPLRWSRETWFDSRLGYSVKSCWGLSFWWIMTGLNTRQSHSPWYKFLGGLPSNFRNTLHRDTDLITVVQISTSGLPVKFKIPGILFVHLHRGLMYAGKTRGQTVCICLEFAGLCCIKQKDLVRFQAGSFFFC